MKRTPLHLSLTYALVAATWILGSDLFVSWLTPGDDYVFTTWQMGKGLLFVSFTTLLLYFLARNYQKRLLIQQNEYRYLFYQNPNPMWVYDLETRGFLRVNQAAVESYGYALSEWETLTLYDIRPAEERALLDESIGRQDKQYANSGVWRHRRKNGEVFFAQIYSQPIEFHGKKARLVVAIDVDKAEEATRQNQQLIEEIKQREAFLNSILQNINEVIWSRHVNEPDLMFMSPATVLHFGYTPEEIIADPGLVARRVHPEDLDRAKRHFSKIKEIGYHAIAYRYQHPDGTERTIYDRARLTRDQDQQPDVVYGVSTDITQLRRLNYEVRLTRQHLATLINSSDDPMVLFDQDLQVQTANQAFYQLLQAHFALPSFTAFEQLAEKMSPEAVDFWHKKLARGLQGQAVQAKIPKAFVIPGALEFQINFQPVEDRGEVVGVACFARDTSAERRRENQILWQNRKLREIAFSQSHHVRPDLANLKALLELIDYDDLNHPQNRPLMARMQVIAERLDGVIHQIVASIYELEQNATAPDQ